MNKKTFIAIKINPDNYLKDIYQNIKSKFDINKIKWVDFNNLHLTIKFIGETSKKNINSIDLILKEITSNISNFEINIKGFGVFPNIKNPHVFWLGIEKHKKLIQIQQKIDTALALQGFPFEKKEFIPHITIAKPKFIKNTYDIRHLIKNFENEVIQQSKVNEIIYYESKINKKEISYIPLKTYKLTK